MRDALKKKIDRAINYIHLFQPTSEPYYCCYSGGKDSECIKELCDMAGADYELHNNHTGMDHPKTVYHIREVMEQYGSMQKIYDEKDGHRIHKYGERGFIHFPLKTMWKLVEEHLAPPTRIVRYCCEELKEKGGKGRVKVLGVRWQESVKRARNGGFVKILGRTKHVTKVVEQVGGGITDASLTPMGGDV